MVEKEEKTGKETHSSRLFWGPFLWIFLTFSTVAGDGHICELQIGHVTLASEPGRLSFISLFHANHVFELRIIFIFKFRFLKI